MKIRLAHLLTDTEAEREKKSNESLSPLSGHGIEYIQHINQRYRGENHLYHKPVYEGNHTAGHYGAFLSFRKAVTQGFTEDLDGFMICECDCVISCEPDRFADLAREAADVCRKNLINYVSFGSPIANGTLWSPAIETDSRYGSFYLTDKIILTHCIFFPRHSREFLLYHLETMTWDALDIWLNYIFRSSTNPPPKRFGILRHPIASQHEGTSLLDNVWKERQ